MQLYAIAKVGLGTALSRNAYLNPLLLTAGVFYLFKVSFFLALLVAGAV